ncbi:hypothetical protein IJI69_02405 [Candidatus Saccharibacteria bacterium]|nr:hypothetical protein [Candidatus Saccharibacteria bacterium]
MERTALDKEICDIKLRNSRVELDKRWETSWTRRLCICFMTYLVVVFYSFLIQYVSSIFLTSLVPVLGFLLSTLSLRGVRMIWQRFIKK